MKKSREWRKQITQDKLIKEITNYDEQREYNTSEDPGWRGQKKECNKKYLKEQNIYIREMNM